MSRSFIIFVLITLLAFTGCTSQAQFLANKQPTAIQAAVTRGQFEMNCPNATGQVLSQEVTQPAIQGPYLQGEERGLFTIGVAGCDQRRVYQVFDDVRKLRDRIRPAPGNLQREQFDLREIPFTVP